MGTTQQVSPSAAVQEALGALAFVIAVMSFVLPVRLRPARCVEVMPAGFGAHGQPLPARFASPDVAARWAMTFAVRRLILSMGLSECVAFVGLMLNRLGGAKIASFSCVIVGILLTLIRFPTLARMVEPFERAHGATFAASMDGSVM